MRGRVGSVADLRLPAESVLTSDWREKKEIRGQSLASSSVSKLKDHRVTGRARLYQQTWVWRWLWHPLANRPQGTSVSSSVQWAGCHLCQRLLCHSVIILCNCSLLCSLQSTMNNRGLCCLEALERLTISSGLSFRFAGLFQRIAPRGQGDNVRGPKSPALHKHQLTLVSSSSDFKS